MTISAILQRVFTNPTLYTTLNGLFLEDWYVGDVGPWLVFQDPHGWAARVFDVNTARFLDDGDMMFPRFTVVEGGRLHDAELDEYYPITPAAQEAA